MAQGIVPVIDISGYFKGSVEDKERIAKQIGEACEKVGFMMIVGHNVPKEIIDGAWKASRDFFDLPLEDKKEVSMSPDYIYGYESGEVLSKSLGQAAAADLKETFQICIGPEKNPDPTIVTPRWPSKPASLKPALTNYYRSLESLASSLLKLFALALNLPENWFEDKIDHHLSALRTLNYPAPTQPPVPGQLRASAHTDYGSLTILRQDDAPGGLQVLNKDGSWQDVSTKGMDAFIINLGDLMARWTNDRWMSTMHRVVNPPLDQAALSRRQSIAFFHNLNKDALVETIPTTVTADTPSKYEPIKAGDLLVLKHKAANY